MVGMRGQRVSFFSTPMMVVSHGTCWENSSTHSMVNQGTVYMLFEDHQKNMPIAVTCKHITTVGMFLDGHQM